MSGKTVLITLVAIVVFSAAILFVFGLFSKRGYGGYPSGFMLEGTTLYVLDNGIKIPGEPPPSFLAPIVPHSKKAIWIIDLDKKRLKDFKKVKNDINNDGDEFWQKIQSERSRFHLGDTDNVVTLGDKTFGLVPSGLLYRNSKAYEIQIKDSSGNLISKVSPPKGNFQELIAGPTGDLYLVGYTYAERGNYAYFLYLFDRNSNQIKKVVDLPLREVVSMDFINSDIYLSGLQLQSEDKTHPYLLLKYDESSNKLEEVLKIKSNDISGRVIKDGKLFLGEKGNLIGTRPPKVTIIDFTGEIEKTVIVGKGIGPNPVTSIGRFGLIWLSLPLVWVLGFFTRFL